MLWMHSKLSESYILACIPEVAGCAMLHLAAQAPLLGILLSARPRGWCVGAAGLLLCQGRQAGLGASLRGGLQVALVILVQQLCGLICAWVSDWATSLQPWQLWAANVTVISPHVPGGAHQWCPAMQQASNPCFLESTPHSPREGQTQQLQGRLWPGAPPQQSGGVS